MRIDRITLAVNNMAAMVRFYNAVFAAGIQPIEKIGDFQFFGGKLAGIEFVMCPNEVACVEASQNRHQLRLVVDDLERLLTTIVNAGGESLDDLVRKDTSKSLGVRDPDGNTIELIQYL